MSELEDENNDNFGPSDRLQSIFAIHKKEGDLHENNKGADFLVIQGDR